jgi:hypothetical protein
LIIEYVFEIGVFGYVCGEFGDTFATPLFDRSWSSHQHHGEIIIKTILNYKTFYVRLVVYITMVRLSYCSSKSDRNCPTDAVRPPSKDGQPGYLRKCSITLVLVDSDAPTHAKVLIRISSSLARLSGPLGATKGVRHINPLHGKSGESTAQLDAHELRMAVVLLSTKYMGKAIVVRGKDALVPSEFALTALHALFATAVTTSARCVQNDRVIVIVAVAAGGDFHGRAFNVPKIIRVGYDFESMGDQNVVTVHGRLHGGHR